MDKDQAKILWNAISTYAKEKAIVEEKRGKDVPEEEFLSIIRKRNLSKDNLHRIFFEVTGLNVENL